MRNHVVLLLSSFIFATTAATGVAQPNPAAQGSAPPPAEPRVNAPPAPTPEAGFQQQYSYALGRNFAENLRLNGIECNLPFLLAGISDTIRKAPPKWTDEQLQPVMERFGQQMQQQMHARMEQIAAKNKQEEANFLTENGKRDGVQTTASGLQFRVVKSGNGASPTLRDTVRCHYRGTLLNGKEFDSSASHGGPAEFPVDGVITGWTEALQKMRVGDKWQLFVPANLGYDMMPPPDSGIEPGSLLVFDIELLEIVQQ